MKMAQEIPQTQKEENREKREENPLFRFLQVVGEKVKEAPHEGSTK